MVKRVPLTEEQRASRDKWRKEAHRKYNAERTLIRNLKKRREVLEKLLEQINSHWEIEDVVYRLYHGSYKAQFARDITAAILKELQGLHRRRWKYRSDLFKQIMEEGLDQNAESRRWVEAMLHARYFLEMAVKYSKEVNKPLQLLPSGYAALLYLYGLR